MGSYITGALVLVQAKELHSLLGEGMASGEVIPLPFTAFRADAVEDAFQHLVPGMIPLTANLSCWIYATRALHSHGHPACDVHIVPSCHLSTPHNLSV